MWSQSIYQLVSINFADNAWFRNLEILTARIYVSAGILLTVLIACAFTALVSQRSPPQFWELITLNFKWIFKADIWFLIRPFGFRWVFVTLVIFTQPFALFSSPKSGTRGFVSVNISPFLITFLHILISNIELGYWAKSRKTSGRTWIRNLDQ